MRGTFLLSVLAVLLLASCHAKTGREEILDSSTKILDEVAKNEADSIPDAVLNRTLCIVVFRENRDQGMASCNEAENRWSRPAVVAFHGERAKDSDLFIFVLGKKESEKLRAGELAIGRGSSAAPGPLARAKPTMTDADLHFSSLIYERKGKVLAGASAAGSVVSAESGGNNASAGKYDERAQRSLASFFNVITPIGIIIHHTAALPESQKVPSNKKEVDKFHSQEGFDVVCFGREYHIAYHYLILPDGSVKEGRPERCEGAHAKGYNAYLGISLAGDFSSKDNPDGKKGLAVPSEKQQESLVKLCNKLKTKYGIPVHRILRHSDVAATECPGDRFPFVQILQKVGP